MITHVVVSSAYEDKDCLLRKYFLVCSHQACRINAIAHEIDSGIVKKNLDT